MPFWCTLQLLVLSLEEDWTIKTCCYLCWISITFGPEENGSKVELPFRNFVLQAFGASFCSCMMLVSTLGLLLFFLFNDFPHSKLQFSPHFSLCLINRLVPPWFILSEEKSMKLSIQTLQILGFILIILKLYYILYSGSTKEKIEKDTGVQIILPSSKQEDAISKILFFNSLNTFLFISHFFYNFNMSNAKLIWL